jgi:hypothetical protein
MMARRVTEQRPHRSPAPFPDCLVLPRVAGEDSARAMSIQHPISLPQGDVRAAQKLGAVEMHAQGDACTPFCASTRSVAGWLSPPRDFAVIDPFISMSGVFAKAGEKDEAELVSAR